MADINTISEKIMRAFQAYLKNDSKLNELVYQMRNSTDYELANEYAVRVGELLSKSMEKYFMYYNIDALTEEDAEKILSPLLTLDHGAVSTIVETIQSNKNAALGIGLPPQLPELDTNRMNGLITEVSTFDNIQDEAGKIKEQVINYSQAVVDEGIKKNATTQAKAGIKTYIIRKAEAPGVKTIAHTVRSKKGKKYTYPYTYSVPCKWCAEVAGTYEYTGNGSNIPSDVYRRHEACRCTLTFVNGNKRQNVWKHSETWTEEDAENQAQTVQAAEEAKKPTTLKKRREQATLTLQNDVGFNDVSASVIRNVDINMLEDNVKQLKALEDRFNVIHSTNVSLGYDGRAKWYGCVRAPYVGSDIELLFSGEGFRDKEQAMRDIFRLSKSGYSVPIDVKSDYVLSNYTVTHEYGHIIQNVLYNRDVLSGATNLDKWQYCVNVKDEIIAIATKNNPAFDINANMSEYGFSYPWEFFAEAFANSQLGAPNEIGVAMETWLKQKGF